MDPDLLPPLLLGLATIFTVGGVLIFRPLSKRIADVMETYLREGREGSRIRANSLSDRLETLEKRLILLEDRQDFTERLMEPRRIGRGKAEIEAAGRSEGDEP